MFSKLVATLLFLALGTQSHAAPELVSPGGSTTLSTVESRCPTYSWTSVEGAAGYELVVQRISALGTVSAGAKPVLQETLPASANSWTPSIENCLTRGAYYQWQVRAIGGENDQWSAPKAFEISPEISDAEFRLALAIIQQHAEQQRFQPISNSGESDAGIAREQRSEIVSPPAKSSTSKVEPEFAVDGSGNVFAANYFGDGGGLTNVLARDLEFDVATQIELDNHKTSSDHDGRNDGRYVNVSGPEQEVSGDLILRNVEFGRVNDGATNAASFNDSAFFYGTTVMTEDSTLRVQGRQEFRCPPANSVPFGRMARVGAYCIDENARANETAANDAVLACAQFGANLCPLAAIQNCDVLDRLSNNPSNYRTCGDLTDSSSGYIWTSTTLTNESGSSFGELLVFSGDGNRTTVGLPSGVSSAAVFCCVPIPGNNN